MTPGGGTAASRRLPRILCVGMPIRDLLFRVSDFPRGGSRNAVSHFDEICGGNALNAAISIARLGGRAALTGPIGDDRETSNRIILERMAIEGIDGAGLVQLPGVVTPTSAVVIDSSGERTNFTYRDPRLWQVRLPEAATLLRDCDAILTEARCAAFAADLYTEAGKRGLPVVVDIDSAVSLQEGLLTAATHLIFSSEALQATAGVADDAEALWKIAQVTPAFLAATRGPAGAIWRDRQGKLRETAGFVVKAVDTLGAGDVFHGAFVLALTERQELAEALRFAAAAAALKCCRHGGSLACPQRVEVEDFLYKHR
jgi:sugar/nucleoside kinase (ribokinase family)